MVQEVHEEMMNVGVKVAMVVSEDGLSAKKVQEMGKMVTPLQ